MLPQLDLAFFPSQIFWLFVCLGLLYLFINYCFFPRMYKMFEERENLIKMENKIYEYSLKEMEALKQKHEDMIKAANSESAIRIRQAEEESKAFIEKRKAEIDGAFNNKFEASKKELLEEIRNFEINLEEEALKCATKIIEKLDGKS